jgi:pyrroline-5-carboxylate reductase
MAIVKRDFYFIGFGNMAQAIYQKMNKSSYENIFLIEKNAQRIKNIKKMNKANFKGSFLSPQTKIIKKLSNNKINNDDIIFLAVKPSQIKSVCVQIRPLVKNTLPLIV